MELVVCVESGENRCDLDEYKKAQLDALNSQREDVANYLNELPIKGAAKARVLRRG